MARADIQAKLDRLVMLLARRPGYLRAHLASLLDVADRTVYRYLEQLEELGYAIDQDSENRYFLASGEASNRVKMEFDVEEVAFLWDLLQGAQDPDGIAPDLRKRFAHSLRPRAREQPSYQATIPQMICVLREAIQERRRICLHDYRSGNSNSLKDRLIDPLHLSEAGGFLQAFEPDSNSVKTFKLARARDLLLTEQPATYHGDFPMVDLFGWTGKTWKIVELRLKYGAVNHMKEEYYGADQFLQASGKEDFPVLARLQVLQWAGIGRFLLSLPGEWELVSTPELSEWVKEQARRHLQ